MKEDTRHVENKEFMSKTDKGLLQINKSKTAQKKTAEVLTGTSQIMASRCLIDILKLIILISNKGDGRLNHNKIPIRMAEVETSSSIKSW